MSRQDFGPAGFTGPAPELGITNPTAVSAGPETAARLAANLASSLNPEPASSPTLDPALDPAPAPAPAAGLEPNDAQNAPNLGPPGLNAPNPNIIPDDDPSRRFCLRWPRLLARFVSLYSKLYRFKVLGYPEDLAGPAIFICWHSEETTLLPNCGFTRGHIMISRSRDGDILASVVKKWGYLVSRGSSSKGAVAALRSMRKAIDQGDNLILAVDGPRGPRRVAKPGAFYLAAKTGRPIYPVGAAVSFAHVFKKSWSHSRLPWPGAKVAAVFGEPIRPTLEDLAKPVAEWVKALTDGLTLATNQAEDYLKNWP